MFLPNLRSIKAQQVYSNCSILMRNGASALNCGVRPSLFGSMPNLVITESRFLSTSYQRQKKFRLTMDEEEKKTKLETIAKQSQEEKPKSMFEKIKFYIKRYWYIAVPVHMIVCSFYFGAFYLIVKSGVDVISIMEKVGLPETVLEKAKSAPPQASILVIAMILYKIATPLRYATTLGGIQGTFWTLRNMGKLKTAREAEFFVRHGYEMNKAKYGLRSKFITKKMPRKSGNK